MATTTVPPRTRARPVRRPVKGAALLNLTRTTDPKQIGIMYLTASFGFFLIGGVMALLMRT